MIVIILTALLAGYKLYVKMCRVRSYDLTDRPTTVEHVDTIHNVDAGDISLVSFVSTRL